MHGPMHLSARRRQPIDALNECNDPISALRRRGKLKRYGERALEESAARADELSTEQDRAAGRGVLAKQNGINLLVIIDVITGPLLLRLNYARA